MPNYDAGHYFLTVLAPIRPDPEIMGGISRSRRHLIEDYLGLMPSGERTGHSQGNALPAPFARTTRTHFARFVVLDDLVFNGRVSGDALLALAAGTNPLAAQRVDRLTTPYLIFVADFDATTGDDAALREYAAALWDTMQDELTAVFRHCIGFATVQTEKAFFDYLKACQIETTMPFNDYWSVMPQLKTFSFTPYIVIAVSALLVFLAGLWRMHAVPIMLALAALVFVVVIGRNKLYAAGMEPFPTAPAPAPGADLPTILKALFLQPHFTDFAVMAQLLDDTALYAAFGDFLVEMRPDDLHMPTQPPGVIGVDAEGASL